MPAQDDYDVAEISERLGPWLSDKLGAPAEIVSLDAPGESGFSSETMLLDVSAADRIERLVIKTKPLGFGVFPEYDMHLQYRCMAAVGAHSDVPVPTMRWYEGDESVLGREFYAMDRVDGDVPTDNLPYTIHGFLYDATPEQQETLYRSSLETLADPHALDWRGIGLSFLDRPAQGATGLDQQLAYFTDYLQFAMEGEPHGPLDDTLAWLIAHRPDGAFDDQLNWGDSRIGNMMYRDFRPCAVLDWEMACVGPGEVDLAWMLYFYRFFSEGVGLPNLPGLPSDDIGIAIYEARTGRPVRHYGWFQVWAGFRYAAILVRLFHKLVAEGTMTEGWTYEENPMVQLMLDVRGEVDGA
jgi:aminoglycoside phosphotransferase (APT) family kinase protein